MTRFHWVGYFLRSLLFLLIALCLIANCHAEMPTHKATHRIESTVVFGTSICSGTAVGPHALLTASHCEEATDDIVLDSKLNAHIEGHIRDGADHTIWLLSGVTFADYITDIEQNWTLQPGDEFYMFGNPNGREDMFRHGYASGFGITAGVPVLYLDANISFGDSGAGVFDVYNRLVGVVSIRTDASENKAFFGGMFSMQFKKADLERARTY